MRSRPKKSSTRFPFLLLLAIADDALGLLILALLYPSGTMSLAALLILMPAAMVLVLWLRRRRVQIFWAYVVGPARLPRDLRTADVLTVGVAASIGFTVSLFFATAAFAEGPALTETKMGRF